MSEGRVLRLHFSCRAELPHGSSLRVTSSNMWGSEVGNGSITKQNGGHFEPGQADSGQAAIFATSVEMVTTPDTYPLWRTRKPVICVVNHISSTKVFRHRYRYLVVTPGAGIHDGYDSKMLTTDHFDGVVDVTEWEDPFSTEDAFEVVVRYVTPFSFL